MGGGVLIINVRDTGATRYFFQISQSGSKDVVFSGISITLGFFLFCIFFFSSICTELNEFGSCTSNLKTSDLFFGVKFGSATFTKCFF